MEIFGYRLKKLREKTGTNQTQIAKIMCVDQKTISNWEKNQSEPSMTELSKLAKIFNIPVQYLLGADNETQSRQARIHAETEAELQTDILLLRQKLEKQEYDYYEIMYEIEMLIQEEMKPFLKEIYDIEPQTQPQKPIN